TDTNPIASPEGAHDRRGYVVRRMRQLGGIDEAPVEAANAGGVSGKLSAPLFGVGAPHVAEVARLALVGRFGDAAQNAGYTVYTTLDARLQAAANRALRLGLLEYDRRRGWRGPTAKVRLPAAPTDALLDDLLVPYESIGNLVPALVTEVG